jgi:(heptosyl)LPS beta-1,4-glucosyltransferase
VSSLSFVSKLVVIDSYSTDATEKVLRESWSASGRDPQDLIFVMARWKGFTQTRNDSLKWVKTPWVMWVDADEWVGADLRDELVEKISEGGAGNVGVFKIPRQSYFLGHAIRHGGWYPDRKARLARTETAEWRGGPNSSDVHEDLFSKAPEPTGLLEHHLYHEPFLDEKEQADTNERYSTLLAEGLSRHILAGEKRLPSRAEIYIKVAIKFLENYFYKAGFLDARPGFLIALGSAKSLKTRLEKACRLVSEARAREKLPYVTKS